MIPDTGWTDVLGYIVVRKAQHAFDSLQRGAFKGGAPCREGKCYHGLDRMPWFDVDEALSAGDLPSDLFDLRKGIRDDNDDGSGVELCRSREDARALLGFSNRSEDRCEIIAVAGDELATVKGLVGSSDAAIVWLGYDVALMGGWSLIGDWVFRGTAPPRDWLAKLNHWGLLDSPFGSEDLVTAYEAAAEAGEAEEVPGPEWVPIALRIGQLLTPDR